FAACPLAAGALARLLAGAGLYAPADAVAAFAAAFALELVLLAGARHLRGEITVAESLAAACPQLRRAAAGAGSLAACLLVAASAGVAAAVAVAVALLVADHLRPRREPARPPAELVALRPAPA